MPRSVVTALSLCLAIFSLIDSDIANATTPVLSVGTVLNRGRPIVCQTGVDRLRERGFHDVWRIDCRGRFFVYRAWKAGRRFEIAVNRHNGRVVDLRRVG
ncbi:MAG: hypothetical protein AAAB35_00985 [Phyllobacterium sp.]|uniref:hypothetical protein n=1 Tax=Phyllobacterium sp. TaxID=1871046 RepID=UPI0030F12E2C